MVHVQQFSLPIFIHVCMCELMPPLCWHLPLQQLLYNHRKTTEGPLK
jgi:hypothetical protein